MPILDDLQEPIRKIILESPLHKLLGQEKALVSFTDHLTGKRLAFSVPYHKEKRVVWVIIPKEGKNWKKFSFGSPLRIAIKGVCYQGWAEIINNPEEIKEEMLSIIKSNPDFSSHIGIPRIDNEKLDLQKYLLNNSEINLLRIEISENR